VDEASQPRLAPPAEALLARLFRGDLLHLKKRAGPDRSYWQARGHVYTAEDISKLW
jgi:hypothetical protein